MHQTETNFSILQSATPEISKGKVLRVHQIEQESAFQVISGFDENLIVVSYDNFEVMMYQKLNSSKILNWEPVEDCHDTSAKIYDAIALKVNLSLAR